MMRKPRLAEYWPRIGLIAGMAIIALSPSAAALAQVERLPDPASWRSPSYDLPISYGSRSPSDLPASGSLGTLPNRDPYVLPDPATLEFIGPSADGTWYPQPYESAPWYDGPSDWTWQILPSGLIYRSYLAGVKESRFSAFVNHESDARLNSGTLWDPTLGARVGLLRFGDCDTIFPQGFQIDAEGSAQARLDIESNVDVLGTDYRAGLPLTYGIGIHRWKFSYYHLSSHVGDEFLLKNPGFPRQNFARDVLVLGYSVYPTPDLRLYAEAGWAFVSDVSEPWEFQFGLDYAPGYPTGFRGAPFFAVNGHLREEVDFGGNLTAQAGWAWRSDIGGHLLRLGVHYYNGHSSQFSYFGEHEEQIGFGAWYDF